MEVRKVETTIEDLVKFSLDNEKWAREKERASWLSKLESIRQPYEVLKPTVNHKGCPCEFCRARDTLIEEVGKLLED